MTEKITYAKAGGPPANWHGLRIFDCDTGAEIKDVIEVSASEGWLVRYVREADWRFAINRSLMEVMTERMTGNFRIELPAASSEDQL